MILKEKLKSGKIIIGTILRITRNPAICYIAKHNGLDFILYDCEHSNYDMETLHDLFITGNALGLDGFLRVPELSKGYISRALDQGASGVMVPMVESYEMAKELVKYSKYQPIGERGFTAGGAHVNYLSGIKHTEIMENCNNKTLTIAQIETKKGVDNAEVIVKTPGLDAILVGANDLSLSLGIPGDLFNKVELEAISHVASACKKNNVAFGLHGGTKFLRKFIDVLDIIMIQSDVGILEDGFKNIKQCCNEIMV